MKWLELAIAAVLDAPALALLGLSFGLGQRFGARSQLWWSGAAAVVAAVSAAWLGNFTGLGSVANAAAVVPVVFAAAYLLGVVCTSRPEVANDNTRVATASVLVAVTVVATLVLWRGDGPVAPIERGGEWVILDGPSLVRSSLVDAIVAGAGIVVLAVLVSVPRLRVRLLVMHRAPELLTRVGHDARQITALFGALTASAAALAGILLARDGAVAPTTAVSLSVLGVEVALLGGLGSFTGVLTSAAVLSLLTSLGNEFRVGWGSLAGHLLVVAMVAWRPGAAAMLRPSGLVEAR